VVNKYKKIFGIKLEVLNNQVNHGPQYTRNKGFKKSKGEFVIFCDADIEMKVDMLEKLHFKITSSKNLAYVYSSHKFGHKIFKNLEFSKERLRQMPFIHTSALIRRECFPVIGFDESIKRLQDWDLWLTMLEQGYIGEWIDEILFKVETGGTMSNWMPSFFYKVFPFLPKVIKYKRAVAVIKKKHRLL
jgi:glycosyltransferase involved in cell wall biosynthesis